MEPGPEKSDDVLGYELATPGARFGARSIDTLIGVAVYVVIFIVVVSVNDISLDVDEDIVIPDGAALTLRFAPVVLWGIYEVGLIRSRGKTVGKLVMRLKVIGTSGDDPPRWNASIFRWGVLVLPMTLIPDLIGIAISLIIGIWFLWDGNRQGLHDKAASTYVVKVPSQVISEP